MRTFEEVVSELKYITNDEGVYYGLDEILEIHKAEQTRPKGKWIEEPNCSYRCSNCGEHYFSIQDYIKYKYCPYCGSYNGESEDKE